MYKITKTSNNDGLEVFFKDNGLEVQDTDKFLLEYICSWKCVDVNTGEMLAAASLQKRSGYFVLGALAVRKDLRRTGIGKEILHIAEQATKQMGADEMWLVAKVPEYYKRFAWKEVDREDAPNISKCFYCNEYEITCFPSVMKKQL